MLRAGCLIVITLKMLAWLVYWGIGHLALVVLLDLRLTTAQVAGGSLLLALFTPVSVRMQR